MKLDVDFLITLMKQYTTSSSEELGEQEAEGGEGGEGAQTGGKGYPSVTKWETGLKRGKGNPVGNTKWAQGHTVGKANPSGQRDKWSTGLVRGKANNLL